MTRSPSLPQVLELHRWLEKDESTPYAERWHRDRGIGREYAGGDTLSLVQFWWSRIGGVADTGDASAISMARVLASALGLAGCAFGVAVTSVALTYQGDFPVNLLTLLGVLVGLPGVLLLLTVLACALRGFGWQPLSQTVESLRLNRWLIGVWDRFSGLTLGSSRPGAALSDVAYWQLVKFSQYFAVAFFLGVTVMFMALVALSDLAFGWSTTLELQAQTVHGWAIAVAAPWSWAWPGLMPDLELVEASRFYRLEAGVRTGQAALLGAWWPFVLLTVLTWGLAPRLAFLWFTAWRLRVATRALLLDHPGVTALVDRLVTPIAEHDGEADEAAPAESAAASIVPRRPGAAMLVWNEAPVRGSSDGPAIMLAATQSDVERRAALESLPRPVDQLVIATKSWEPPLLEFNDLLALVRTCLGDEVSILVAPLGVDGGRPPAAELEIWSVAVARLQDSRTYVAGIGAEAANEGAPP